MFSREEYINWLSNTKWSALKNVLTGNIIQTKQVVIMYLEKSVCISMCMYTYVHVTTMVKDHEFEKEQERTYGKVWREEREGGNDVITTF